MAATGLWLGVDLRPRARALLTLARLIALSCGTVLVDVSRSLVSHFHLGIGDHVVFELPTESELMDQSSDLHGPTVKATIVGVVESPWFSDGPGSPGDIYPSFGLAKHYPVGHAPARAVRRRSKDLAVLRALGMTPGQCRRVVIVQSTLLGIIGLVFGVPNGVALGRIVWSAVATYTPLQYVTPRAGWQRPLIVPAVLLTVNASRCMAQPSARPPARGSCPADRVTVT